MFRIRRWSLVLLLGSLATAGADEDGADYVRVLKPLLRERCFACHGSLKQESGLRVDTVALLRRGGESGPALVPGAPADSVLLERIDTDDETYRMPPIGKPLTPEQVAQFRRWISEGAPAPPGELPEPDPASHWAFQRPVRPPLPVTGDTDWPRAAIDHFIQAQHEQALLTPADDADPATLLRRVTLDLTGLPPTVEELNEFLADPREVRYRAIVDRLLASPQYGERWGRHWMDIWRYSDWYGRRQVNDVRNSAPQIWRWRDWIVHSLNQDKSYARMLQEMLAADEIAAADDSAWPATGYLVRNYYSLNPNEWMRHNVEYTARAFLGLTWNCAHCHDHKYDPISHVDYFRLRAFFEPIGIRQDRVAGEPEPPPFEPYTYAGSRKVVREGMVRIYDEKPDAPTWFYTGGDERNRDTERGSIAPGIPAIGGLVMPAIEPVQLPMSAWYPGSRPGIQQSILQEKRRELEASEQHLKELRRTNRDTSQLRAAVAAAEQGLDRAIDDARAAGETGALQGRQSLLLDATNGRRIIQNALTECGTVTEDTTIAFRLRILQESHFNFQLARDNQKSLTALYVGFVNGAIRAYKPGSFAEFQVGTYATSPNGVTMDVALVLSPSTDTATLNITADSDHEIVSAATIALNGWNTRTGPQPCIFDCRPGTRVLLDDVRVTNGGNRFSCGFEEPVYTDSVDIAGTDGWAIHSLSAAGALSVPSLTAGCPSAHDAYSALVQARSAFDKALLPRTVAELQVRACQASLESATATIKADNARREQASQEQVNTLSRDARQRELQAIEANARWRMQSSRLDLAAAESLPESNKEKPQRQKSARTAMTAAHTALQTVAKRRAGQESDTLYTPLSPRTAPTSSGRRTALAKWITDDAQPLTPRVAVNHVWMRHFGTPLVESVYDFGRNGAAPTHPRLLDWLAVEFVENDWSLKHLHRLIVTSRAYRMSSTARPQDENLMRDADNHLLWRMNTTRMEAEVVRDSALSAAGLLDSTVGGPVLPNTQAATTFRRSLYYEVYPEAGGSTDLADVFDAPDPTECFRRTSTVVPQQALALSNSELVHRCSRAAAEGLDDESMNDEAFVTRAFAQILSRLPTRDELRTVTDYLRKRRAQLSEIEVRASLFRVLFNHNDFVTIR